MFSGGVLVYVTLLLLGALAALVAGLRFGPAAWRGFWRTDPDEQLVIYLRGLSRVGLWGMGGAFLAGGLHFAGQERVGVAVLVLVLVMVVFGPAVTWMSGLIRMAGEDGDQGEVDPRFENPARRARPGAVHRGPATVMMPAASVTSRPVWRARVGADEEVDTLESSALAARHPRLRPPSVEEPEVASGPPVRPLLARPPRNPRD